MENQVPRWGEEVAKFGPVSLHQVGSRMMEILAPYRPEMFMVVSHLEGEEPQLITMVSMYLSALPDILNQIEIHLQYNGKMFRDSEQRLRDLDQESNKQWLIGRDIDINKITLKAIQSVEKCRKLDAYIIRCLHKFHERYPHVQARDSIANDPSLNHSSSPSPPASHQLRGYVFDGKNDDLMLSQWGELGPIQQSIGSFIIRSFITIKYGKRFPHVYFAIQCEEQEQTIDVGILHIDELDVDGIQQRIAACLASYEIALSLVDYAISFVSDTERVERMYQLIQPFHERYTIIASRFYATFNSAVTGQRDEL